MFTFAEWILASLTGSCPKQPVWKLVGVYPVVDGFAQLDLKAVEGKGQTEDTALYIVPGESTTARCFAFKSAVCTALYGFPFCMIKVACPQVHFTSLRQLYLLWHRRLAE